MARHPGEHIVLLDLYSTGHHRTYLEMLVEYWVRTGMSGRLTLVVTSDFDVRHPDFVSRLRDMERKGLALREIQTDIRSGWGGIWRLFQAGLEHGKAARNVLDTLAPDHLLFMYFDHVQLAIPGLASEAERSGTHLSGIYFRPAFHADGNGLHAVMTALRKRWIARRAMRSGGMHRLFCLDPYVVDEINDWAPEARRDVAIYLPDGVSHPQPDLDREARRRLWCCAQDDVVFLFFGSIERRKGIFVLLDALENLDDEVRSRSRFIVAGSIPDGERETVVSRIDALPPNTRISLDDRYIPDAEMASCFQACDVVLVPYVGHVGSSNVMIRAAGAGKPVIGPESGLVGKQIRDHGLGLAVDTRDASEVRRALIVCADDASAVFDPGRARAFAEVNSATNFAKTVFNGLEPGRNSNVDETFADGRT